VPGGPQRFSFRAHHGDHGHDPDEDDLEELESDREPGEGAGQDRDVGDAPVLLARSHGLLEVDHGVVDVAARQSEPHDRAEDEVPLCSVHRLTDAERKAKNKS